MKRIIFSLLIIAAIGLGGKYLYDKGHNDGFLKGYPKGHENGALKGFNEAYLNTAEKYMISRAQARKTSVKIKNPNLNLDYRELAEQLFLASDFGTKVSKENFSKALYSTHTAILEELVSQTNTNENIKGRVFSIYDSLHTYLSVEYYDRFRNRVEEELDVDPVHQRKAYTAADEFNYLVSESICDLVSAVEIAFFVSVGSPIALAKTGISKAVKRTGSKKVKAAANVSAFPKAGEVTEFAALDILSPCQKIISEFRPDLNMSFKEAGAYVGYAELEYRIWQLYEE